MDETQREQMRAAVERKKEAARARSEQHAPSGAPADEEAKRLRAEEERESRRGRSSQADARAKNSKHGQITADKWNQ